MRPVIDLNADVGEGFGVWPPGHDDQVIPLVTSANVACGFHAGDPGVMRRTVALAAARGVAVGAHPGFPDLLGFGRRRLDASPREVRDYCVYQIGALWATARAERVRLQHVKAHGALYNLAAVDDDLARAIAEAVASVDGDLILLALPGSAMERAGAAAGLRVAREAFADRSYQPDGTLTPRGRPGAVLGDPPVVVDRAVRLVTTGAVETVAGTALRLECDSLCVHGDNPRAPELLRALRRGLEAAGVRLAPLGAVLEEATGRDR